MLLVRVIQVEGRFLDGVGCCDSRCVNRLTARDVVCLRHVGVAALVAHTSLRLLDSAVFSFSKFKFLFHLLDPLLTLDQLTLKPQKLGFPQFIFLLLLIVEFLSLLPFEGQPAH